MERVRDTFTTHSRAKFGPDKIAKRARRRALEATVIKVDGAVWQTAMDLAQGDALRIQVVSETEVVVLNRRR